MSFLNTATSCSTATSTALSYTTLPTTYTLVTYSYTATFTGIAILEFGFKAKNTAQTWHLDDVSIIDTSASNAQRLTNGDFENGTLVGWQVLCTVNNGCGGPGGGLTTSSCHSGTYCYSGACFNAFDFLRQTFSTITGHVYTLTFWIYTNGHNQQEAYVRIG